MDSMLDKARGKLKEMLGQKSGNRNLEGKGHLEQAKGHAKDAVSDAKDGVDDLTHSSST